MGHSDRAAAFLSLPRGGIYADSFIISSLNNAWGANDNPKSCRGARMYFHNSFLFERRWGDGSLKKKKFSLRNKDGKHSLEGFVSSWWISGGAFLGGVISETAFWALMLVLYFLSCNRRINTQKKSWGSSCSHTSPPTQGPVEGAMGKWEKLWGVRRYENWGLESSGRTCLDILPASLEIIPL